MAAQGVSILITFYNGVKTIGAVIDALNRQTGLEGLSAEVILVDNNPKEPFDKQTLTQWTRSDIPFRIVYESRPGNFFTKKRGLSEARYDYIVFLEDDTIPDRNWVANGYHYLNAYPACGMVGGENRALFMIEPTPWFMQYLAYLAVGKQGNGKSDDISHKQGYLWGAGLIARKTILTTYYELMRYDLPQLHHHPFLTSVDAGFCRTARLMGFELHYSDTLLLQHVISPYRMSWVNMQLIYQQLGAESIWIDLFNHYFEQGNKTWVHRYLFKLYFGSTYRYFFHFYNYLFRSSGKVNNRQFLLTRYYRFRLGSLRWQNFGSFIDLLRRMQAIRKQNIPFEKAASERVPS